MAEAATQQKVLVYGATGSQARPVATKLLNAGHSVRVLSRDSSKVDAVFPGMGESAAQGYAMAYEHPEMFSSNVDLGAALEKMPIELTPLETWVTQREGAFSSQNTQESIK